MKTTRVKSRKGKLERSVAAVNIRTANHAPEPTQSSTPTVGSRPEDETYTQMPTEPPETQRRDSSFRLRKPGAEFAEEASNFDPNWSRTSDARNLHPDEFEEQNAELRRTQRELQESRKRYFDLYNGASLAFCTIDERGRILEANRRAAEMLVTSVEALENQPLTRYVPPEDHDIFFQQQRQVFGTLGSAAFEIRMRQTTGTEIVLWMVLVAEFGDVSGQAVVGRVTMSDISLCRQLEQDRRTLQHQLFHAQKLESIGTLAGAIAHDFNNLLASIVANLENLDLECLDPSARRECLDDIKALTQRGADLTKQLLGFARRDKFDMAPLDFDAVVEKVCSVFERTHKNITLRLEVGVHMICILADRGQIEQVLLNLLVNAGLAMPGGGELRVKSEAVLLGTYEADCHAIRPGSYVKLSVIDNGVGMTDAVRTRIFEPFFTTRGPGNGSGLGLASVHGITKNHHGFVAVESTPGEGSAFHVYLPITERGPILPLMAVGEMPHRGVETLLLVDDEEQVIKSWGRTLRHLGYHVHVARNGYEAIAILQQRSNEISLVILDLIMPGMGGKETFDEIQKLAPGLKVLLWSGYDSDGLASELLARGCSGFIQKPAGVAALSTKLRELL